MNAVIRVGARVLVAAPFFVPAAFAVGQSLGMVAPAPRMFPGLPDFVWFTVLAITALTGVVIALGLPLYRRVATASGLVVLALAFTAAPFWHVLGEERLMMLAFFAAHMAHAGGLFLIGASRAR